jgi:hypothetical protein
VDTLSCNGRCPEIPTECLSRFLLAWLTFSA